MTNEKIKKLQLEIAKTTEAQKKSEQKYKEKIKGLRDELKKEEERLKRENDSLIGDIVRDLLGEVDADNIESFITLYFVVFLFTNTICNGTIYMLMVFN
ncbi:hypothetical protein PNE36_04120 [[Eubacterium] rectale]|uniref:Uncharacterized protein n=1 Tax=Agathobacter rectalis TaxID=39491 RepID=A0AAP3Q0R6_9FIRM|nr:hypothetical protein [Agathobacter rectalis]MDB8014109.1 hypothetical protein [Agathobacter rectalis]MDB8017031.1 hypothetical protein [Agathobacter rectalis]MDB8020539.1 hypothetical protein [Agathobacter rectalis]MDB8028106.1 hypothetical protein [Agathobacter rectalis]